MADKIYKIVVFGDEEVGKSELIRSICPDSKSISYMLYDGRDIRLNFCEVALEDPDACLIGADAVIFMFSILRKKSCANIPFLHKRCFRILGEIPYVVCGNKIDLCEVVKRAVSLADVTFAKSKKIKYLDISAKTGFNVERSIEHLLRGLLKDDVYIKHKIL